MAKGSHLQITLKSFGGKKRVYTCVYREKKETKVKNRGQNDKLMNL